MKRTSNQNIIHSSEFNFEYSTEASATRGNALIESIFQSQILPEIEKAISNKIPDDLLIELSKLEINIGRIDESTLSAELSDRIRESLETALDINYKRSVFGGKAKDKYGFEIDLPEIIGLFLSKGYLPNGQFNNLTLSQLIDKALLQNKNATLDLMVRQSNINQVAQRLANNINDRTLDNIIFALNGTSKSLLADFRKTMLFVRKTIGISNYKELHFSQLLNCYILEYTLKTNQLNSAKEYLLINVLERFKNEFQIEYQELITTISDFHLDTANKKAILTALQNLIDKKPKYESKDSGFNDTSSIQELNAGNSTDLDENAKTLSFEKAVKQVLKDIQNEKSNNVNPSETGLKEGNKRLFAFFERFLAKNEALLGVVGSNSINALINSMLDENESVFIDLLKKNCKQKNAINNILINTSSETFDKIIIVLEPENSAWIIESRKILIRVKKESKLSRFSDSYFRQIVNFSILQYLLNSNGPNFNYKKFTEFVFSEIREVLESNLQTIINSEKLTKGNSAVTDVMLATSGNLDLKEKGHLKANERLEFKEVIEFLNSGASLFENIKKTYSKIEKLSIKQEDYLEQKTSIQEYNLPVIKRNIVSFYLDYGYLPKAYLSANKKEVQQIFNELIAANDDFLVQKFYEAKDPVRLIESVELLAAGVPGNNLRDYLSHFFVDEFRFLTNIISKTQEFLGSNKINTLNSITVIDTIFIEALAKSKGNKLYGVFSFIVFDKLSEELDEKSISLEKFHQYYSAESLKLEKLKTQSEYDEEFEKHKEDNIKTVLEQNFEWLLNKHRGYQFEFQESDIETKTLIRKLAFYAQFNSLEFTEVIVKNRDRLSQILALLKYYSLPEGYTQILHVLMQQTNLKNEVDDFQQQKFVERKLDSTESSIGNNSFFEDLNYCVLSFKFYANNGFFPWWSKQASFADLMKLLKIQSSLYPSVFEKVFLELAKDEQFFADSFRWISHVERNELKLLFADHKSLKNLWNKFSDIDNYNEDLVELPNAVLKEKLELAKYIDIDDFIKNSHLDSSLLFKGIYFFEDETILKRWLGERTSIRNQLKEYLDLSPLLYYSSLSSIQWRTLVYSYAFKFYENEKQEKKERFHHQFLSFLKIQKRHINWKDVFSQVYDTVQTSNKEGSVQFPKQLIQILNIDNKTDISMEFRDSDSIEEEGIEIRVSNAGVIILWPFLTQLFEHLSFMKNGSFENNEARNRAVYVLQYLVFTNIDFPEYELTLNKLFVGMKMEEHLDPFVTLSENEQEMAGSLLNGLINNWEKVKSSTPEGLQETFLQRQGILKFYKDEVILEVEKMGVDVLMESIPWNISVIKLAWMQKPLNVKWI